MKAPKLKEPWNKGKLAGKKAPLKLKENLPKPCMTPSPWRARLGHRWALTSWMLWQNILGRRRGGTIFTRLRGRTCDPSWRPPVPSVSGAVSF